MILSVIEKLLIFQYNYRMTGIELAEELEVSPVYLSMVMNDKRNLSDKLIDKIELLFRRYHCVEFLDDKGGDFKSR